MGPLRFLLAPALLAMGALIPDAACAAQEFVMASFSFLVEPFANSSGDPGQDYLAGDVTDDLTTALSRIEDSFIIAHSSAQAVAPGPVDLVETAHRVGVHFILGGDVRREGTRIRLVARLVNADGGGELWSATFDRDLVELPAIEREIVSKLAGAVGAKIAGQTAPPSIAQDADAYDALLRGKALLRMPQTPERLAEARNLLNRARRANPNSADALIGLASIHVAVALAGLSRSPEWELREGERLAEQALSIESHNAAAFDILGAMRRAAGRKREALAAYEAAYSANRSDANACAQIARLKIDLGEAKEAIPLIEQALRLSPADPQRSLWYTYAGLAALYADDPQRARSWLEKAVEANPRFVTSLVLLAAAEELGGDHPAARRSIDRALVIAPQLTIGRVDMQLAPEEPGARSQWTSLLGSLRRAGVPQ